MEFFALDSRLGTGAETMKASNFSDAQKAFVLKQGDDGVPVAEICRKAGISQATVIPPLNNRGLVPCRNSIVSGIFSGIHNSTALTDITPVSYAWTNSKKSRLQFDLSPAAGVYSLSVRLVPLFDLTPLDGTSAHINGHEAKLKLDGTLMTADVPGQWLVDGNNVIELGFQLNPSWGVGAPVDNVALKMKR